MNLARTLRHLSTGGLLLRKRFDAATLSAIEQAVRDCESRHAGEIRFAVEAGLSLSALWHDQSPQDRAVEVFSELRVWDTEHNNGVLIYVLLADRDVEIVADRGVAGGAVPQAEWEACCRIMEAHFHGGRFREGAMAGVAAVAEVLARHPPGAPGRRNELPDKPVIL